MMVSQKQRGKSYGEQRTFRGLEDFAIRQRVSRTSVFLEQLRREHLGETLKVIELGCGFRGSNLMKLNARFSEVRFTGVDVSVDKENATVQLIQADLAAWKPTERYDGVLSLAVAEHLLDPAHHFALIAECLERGGLAGMTTPTPQAHVLLKALGRLRIFDREEIEDHKLYLTLTGLGAMAAQAGLKVEQYEQFSFGMNQWMLLRRT